MFLRQYKLQDGIYVFDEDIEEINEDYNAYGLDMLFKSEELHFWFVTRKKFIFRNVTKFINKDDKILDLGCGTGNIAKYFLDRGFKNISVADMHLNGLKYAQSKGIQNCFRFDILKPTFQDEFDVIFMFDVLEHIQEDRKVIEQLSYMLKHKGKVAITVPAHQWLWSKIDDMSGHKKRYTKKEIISLLKDSGFNILYARYFFMYLVPLLLLRKFLINRKSNINFKTIEEMELKINPCINKALLIIGHLENFVNPALPNYFGGSLLVIGGKKVIRGKND